MYYLAALRVTKKLVDCRPSGMPAQHNPILPLPPDVAKQIRSSTAISSLNGVVVGLFKNSLDAGAARIKIEVDYRHGACTVEDDGQGIEPPEFFENGGLAKPHRECTLRLFEYPLTSLDTSKGDSQHRLHGQNGTFLSSVAALSTLTVTSHHSSSRSHATLILHHSRPAARMIPAPTHHQLSYREHGTKVEVRDLFGNMPVRVKRRLHESGDTKEHERMMNNLKKELVGLLLAWSRPTDVSVTDSQGLRKLNVRGKEKLSFAEHNNLASLPNVSLALIRKLLSQASYIEPSTWENWMKVSARTPLITVKGAISLEPAPSKLVQFISVGVNSIDASTGGNALFDNINQLFAASSFGVREESVSTEVSASKPDRRRKHDGFTTKQLKGSGKGVDRWPMFSFHIELHHDQAFASQSPKYSSNNENTISIISKVLAAMVTEFLEDNHFRNKQRTTRKRQQPAQASAPSVKVSPRASLGLKTGRHDEDQSLDSHFTELAHHKVKIPKLSVTSPRSHADGFSSWSRIKSSSRHTTDEAISQKSIPQVQARISDVSPPTLKSPNNCCLTKNKPLTATPAASLQADLLDSFIAADNDLAPISTCRNTNDDAFTDRPSGPDGREEVISWTNPISRLTILVNARTGLAVAECCTQPLSSGHRQPSPPSSARISLRFSDISLPSVSSSKSSAYSSERSWLRGFLKDWNNPVFKQTEEALPQISPDGLNLEASMIMRARHHRFSDKHTQKAFAESSSSSFAKLSKSSLDEADVISQVEKQFILVSMKATIPAPASPADSNDEGSILVLIDQHAADERIRVEGLLAELCALPSRDDDSASCGVDPRVLRSAVATTMIGKPMNFEIPPGEHKLFDKQRSHFASWGILYDLSLAQEPDSGFGKNSCRLTVKSLPEAIAERCRSEPKILAELLRSEIWKREDPGRIKDSRIGITNAQKPQGSASVEESWVTRIHDCPQGILDMIFSRSCRSAIMFNDELTMEDCRSLIQRLARCAFPFQCAHGRPSMIPVASLSASTEGSRAGGTAFVSRPTTAKAVGEEVCFSKAWREWRMQNF